MALFKAIFQKQTLRTIDGLLYRKSLPAVVQLLSTKSINKEEKYQTDITELKGRPWLILASPAEVSLVCSVSADFEMHRGIARDFKKKFENINELKQQNKVVGQAAVLKRNDTSFVYYLLVRNRWWDRATPEAFHSSITDMKEHCIKHGITQLAIPRIGTGDDGVSWGVIKDIVEKVFQDTGITIKAYTTR
ncbi:ADP-ribose glycohydrolase OARD1-like [Actinia tenebrosa]|uniref:ADP-ribose glycohydrolase OARD1-like n=1 Tax=Actinia tenebrosa TaxID=6105 RepID=A0A6P8IXC4_ACTTE|nr:ADP-ribose glycohydrolase OARD1-like [Actinia tenebrosa]